jgi:hypothetical protein
VSFSDRQLDMDGRLLMLIVGILVIVAFIMTARHMIYANGQETPAQMTHPQEHMLELLGRLPAGAEGLATGNTGAGGEAAGNFELAVAPGSKGTITWVMHSYASTIKAGAELVAHELTKFLQRAGWKIRVMLYDHTMESFDGIELIKMPYKAPLDAACRTVLKETDIILTQNFTPEDVLKIAEEFGLPVCFFLHLDVEKIEVLQQRWTVPVYIVYNAMTQHEVVPTIHKWTVVRPHVDYSKFEAVDASKGKYVTLLNCIANKGGQTIKRVAEMMPDIPFMGVKGGYGDQVLDGSVSNLVYKEHTANPLPYYAESRIIIMPSKHESWGRVALEAMAAGVPVIVGDTPGLRECTAGAAPICRQEDYGCWEREIRRLYPDGAARTAAIAAGKRRIADLKGINDYAAFDKYLMDTVKPRGKILGF